MRRFWTRQGTDDIAARLRRERPQPPDELVEGIARRVQSGRWRRVVGLRVGLAAAVTVLLVAGAAGFGGAGYASIAVENARSAAEKAAGLSKNGDGAEASAKGNGREKASRRGGKDRDDDDRGGGDDDDGDDGGDDGEPDDDQYGRDRVVICHRTPSGRAKTLVLPQPAARAHLRNHDDDTPGPCPARR